MIKEGAGVATCVNDLLGSLELQGYLFRKREIIKPLKTNNSKLISGKKQILTLGNVTFDNKNEGKIAKQVIDIIREKSMGTEAIFNIINMQEKVGCDIAKLQIILNEMELEELIVNVGGKWELKV